MAEPLEKQLINIFALAWSDAAPSLVGAASSLSLIAQREAAGEEVKPALEIAPGFTSAFAATCSGALGGVLLCLFKKEDRQQLELFISKMMSGDGVAGIPALIPKLINATLTATAASLPEAASFGDVTHIELANGDNIASSLLAAVGEKVWVNTFTLTVGERLNSQMLVLYAPHGSIEMLQAEQAATANAAAAGASGGFTNKRRAGALREDSSRNMERLLDVELEVVVRFGLTQIPLRELVRIGVGSMIELNRQVDEPVELLVNNRPLARGSVVVVDGYYGVCITEIGQMEERRQSLTKA
jgi:flagellar motor switch protein FliN